MPTSMQRELAEHRPGTDVPIFDIGEMYQSGEQQDLLVRNARFGTGLATSFLKDSEARADATTPDYAVVLMRRHGYTTHGRDIETAVCSHSPLNQVDLV
jgi:hypothetical protein